MSNSGEMPAKIGFGNIFAGGQVKLKSRGPPASSENKPKSKPTPPAITRNKARKVVLKAEAEFDYEAEQTDEISFDEGDIFIVYSKEIYDGWAEGEINGHRGVFPNNFVRFFEEEEEDDSKKPKPSPSPKPVRSNPLSAPPTSAPPTSKPSAPPGSAPPSSAPPKTGPPNRSISETPSGRPLSAPVPPSNLHDTRSGSIAAKAAFLNGELLKTGGGPGMGMGMSLPRKMNPSQMKNFGNFNDDMNTQNRSKTFSQSQGFTADELRQFAIEHKDEFKRTKNNSPDGKRTPAKFDTVPKVTDVRVKMSSNSRNRTRAPSVTTGDRPLGKSPVPVTVSEPLAAAPPPSNPAPSRLSMSPSVEPPKPPASPSPARKQFRPAVPPNKPTPSPTPPSKPPLYTAALRNSPISEENSDLYMDMELGDQAETRASDGLAEELEELRSRVAAMEAATEENNDLIAILQDGSSAGSSAGSASVPDMEELKRRLAAAESSNMKTNKLIAMLQRDLDEEINTRKQLETDVSRLKRIVEVLQD